ncbi:DUF2243 domain-containing protein [Lysobacter sp. HA18]
MTQRSPAPVRAAGLAIGMGMGGFVDGIVFHQILQLHNMLSARIPNDVLVGAKINMVWDGFFHAGVWLLTAAGIALLWRACRRRDALLSTRLFVGALLAGWGVFNLVEGVIDHLLLQIHHVVQVLGLSIWDYVFLAWGAAMLLVGIALMRRAQTT